MRPRPLYQVSLLDTARHIGLRQAVGKLLLRILRIRPVILVALTLDREAPADDGEQRIRRAGPEDDALFATAGFAGMLHGKLAQGPGWISVGDAGLEAWYFLARGESMIGDWLIVRTASPTAIWAAGIWVHRDRRGGDLARRIRAPVMRWSRERGYREIVTWVDLTNHSSRRAIGKAGYREVGRLTVLRLFGVALVHCGRRWRFGRRSDERPLTIDVDSLRQGAGSAADDGNRQAAVGGPPQKAS